MYNIIIPEKIFHLPETEVKLLLVWYAKQPLKIQIEAMKLSSDLFFQWRDKYPTGKNEVRFGTFVLALKKMRHFDHIITGKNPNHDLEKIRKVTEMKADRFLARKKAERKRKNSNLRGGIYCPWWSIFSLLYRVSCGSYFRSKEILVGISFSLDTLGGNGGIGRHNTFHCEGERECRLS